jgi:hypothetical protein
MDVFGMFPLPVDLEVPNGYLEAGADFPALYKRKNRLSSLNFFCDASQPRAKRRARRPGRTARSPA